MFSTANRAFCRGGGGWILFNKHLQANALCMVARLPDRHPTEKDPVGFGGKILDPGVPTGISFQTVGAY